MRAFRLFLCSALAFTLAGCGKESKTIKEANQFMEQRNYYQAKAVLEKAIRENPKSKKLLRQYVVYYLKTEEVGFSIAAYRRLNEISPKDDVFYDALGNHDPVIRVTAARALGYMKDPDSEPALIRTAKDPENSVRIAVVQALGDLKDKKALPVLIDFLKDSDWFVRGEAALALGKIGDAKAASQLFKLLNDEDAYVRENTRKALEDLATEDNKQAYLDALQNSDFQIQTMAAVGLAHAGHTEGVKILVAQLENPQNKNLTDVIRALMRIKDPSALPGLRKCVSHEDPQVQIQAILALGAYRDKASESLLKNLLDDRNQIGPVRTASAIALNALNGKN